MAYPKSVWYITVCLEEVPLGIALMRWFEWVVFFKTRKSGCKRLNGVSFDIGMNIRLGVSVFAWKNQFTFFGDRDMKKIALIAVAGLAAVATAEPLTAGNGSGGSTGTAINLLDYATVTQTRGSGNTIVTITFNTDIDIYDLQGDPNNLVLDINLGGPATMHGIGWDVTQFAIANSWLSEQVVSFANAGDAPGLFLTPSGTSAPGTESNSSGGILDLSDNSIPDLVMASGIMRMEFFETFDDFADAPDGRWLEGSTLTFDMTLVPAPGALALLGLGGLVTTRRRR